MKHLKYASYVLRHRWFVFVECLKLGIIWRGLVHDLSKFLPSEWFPYVNYFNGEWRCKGDVPKDYKAPKPIEAAFDLAWLKHQHRNPHHWQFWRLREDDGGTKLIPMPPKYVKEMLADWRGAGRAQGFDKLGPWYEKNHLKIELHRESRDLLHSLMEPDELPPKEKVLVYDKISVESVSVMPDGSMQMAGKVEESHTEERFVGAPKQGVSVGSRGKVREKT